MANIKKRGKSWQVRYRGPDGRERSKTFPRRIDAEQWVSTQRADMARGIWTDPQLGRIRLEDWIALWEATTFGLRPTTRELNRGVIENYLLPRFGGWPIASISTTDVQAMVATELAKGRLGPSAIRRHVIVLSSILGGAVESGRIA